MQPIIEGSNSLLALIITLSVFLGLSLGMFLLFIKSHKNKANLFLGILLLGYTFFTIPSFLFSLSLLDDFPHVVKIYPLLAFLNGPLVYFYVRSCTQKGFTLTPKMYLHFIPFLIGILIHLPFLMKSGAEKYAFHIYFFETSDSGEPLWLNALKTIHILIYYVISMRIILHYKKHLSNAASNIDVSIHRWLIIFTSILLLRIMAVVIFALGAASTSTIMFVFFTLFFFLLAVYSCLILKPSFFHHFPHQMLIPDSKEEKRQKYERSTLQADQKEEYLELILSYVENKCPYRQAELSLTELSEMIDIPSHYLSQVINEKLECNFLDFINSYRINEVKEKLVDPAFNHYTIIALAYEVGFNSKTAFYSAFKKQTGTTPSAYKKSVPSEIPVGS